MGGAGTAAGNDSAMPYLNPAGMAGLPRDVFAVSASVYGWSRRSIPKLQHPRGFVSAWGDATTIYENSEAKGIFELPSAVMYFHPIGDNTAEGRHLIGASLIVPNSSKTDLVGSYGVKFPSSNVSASEQLAVSQRRTEYYTGPTYALAIGDSVRLGLSAFFVYTQVFRVNQIKFDHALGGGAYPSSIGSESSTASNSLDFVPVFGAQVQFVEHFWGGLGVAAPSFHLQGNTAGSYYDSNTLFLPTGAASADSMTTSTTGQYTDNKPLRLNAGVAYENRKGFSVALDGTIFIERSPGQVRKGTRQVTHSQTGQLTRQYAEDFEEENDVVQGVNVAAGAEYAFTPVLAVRVGGFTDAPSTKAFDAAEFRRAYTYREDRWGATLGLGLTFGSFDSTIGMVYTHGSGKFLTVDYASDASLQGMAAGDLSAPLVPVPTSYDSLLFVWSGAVSTEEAKATIQTHSPVRVDVNAPGIPR
jgi:hypothetical protein